jgi:choline dehydrogenase-like flavoprotein
VACGGAAPAAQAGAEAAVPRLSGRRRAALAAICDTFAPESATRGAPERILDIVAANPRASERAQLGLLLSLFAVRRFDALPQGRREAVLRGWCDSRIPQRRAAFQAFRKGALHFDAVLPGQGGGPSAVYEAAGYPGALGPPVHAPPRTIAPVRVAADAEFDCDVCVVGSGAGGGTAAAVLAAAGLDVVVLEAGDYYDDADFDGAEFAGWRRLYVQGGAAATQDQSVGLLAASCLGGTTVVNYSTSFRTPDEVRAEWAAYGVPAFTSAEYTESLDLVSERLAVNLDHNRLSSRDEIFRRGLRALDWHCDKMPRNVSGCDQEGSECGWCGFGCRRGAKQSALKTWLVDAHADGARVLVRTQARRVIIEDGTARGVEARTAEGHRVTVRARAVVAACGAIQTPALLRRSGLSNRELGRNLRLHPATGVFGFFEDEVRPWEGTMQAVYSDQHRDLDGAGYGVKYETAAIHPSLFAAFAPWRSAAQYSELVANLSRVGLVGVLLRDRGGGEVRVGRDGEPITRYRLSEQDTRHVRVGLDGAAQILEAAGARRVISAHSRFVSYEPRLSSRERFIADGDACGYGAGRCIFYSFHIMGSVRMGGSRANSACGPEGETWEARNLVVCDGSTFPTASGVNPMISIEAIAHLNASALAARLS